MIRRDSKVLLLSLIGAVLGYLMTLPPPTEWTYLQWLQSLAFTVATVSAKLGGSPLKGKPKGDL